eukprot:scaffold704_cov347-Prasinococcus_capsulatus_cf.AAC.32
MDRVLEGVAQRQQRCLALGDVLRLIVVVGCAARRCRALRRCGRLAMCLLMQFGLLVLCMVGKSGGALMSLPGEDAHSGVVLA